MGAMAETKTSRARVAFALLCGLAVCCSVMYITADASESVLSMAEKAEDKHIGAGFHRHTPTSVESVDVKKAARIITTTPDGRERLMDFLNKVEKQIRTEVAGRKADIAAVRAKMAKNMAYNAAARSKMGKSLLAKMAVNAKAAKDALDKAMRQTQAKFAAAAALENSRNAATMKRAAQTRALMRKNKAEAAKALAHAVLNHQRQLAALDQANGQGPQELRAQARQGHQHPVQCAQEERRGPSQGQQGSDHGHPPCEDGRRCRSPQRRECLRCQARQDAQDCPAPSGQGQPQDEQADWHRREERCSRHRWPCQACCRLQVQQEPAQGCRA